MAGEVKVSAVKRFTTSAAKVVISAKDAAEGAVNPKPGDRKVRITLIVTAVFLTIAVGAMIYWGRENILDFVKLIGDFLWKSLLVFIGGNSIERASQAFGKNGIPVGEGNGKDGDLPVVNDEGPPIAP